MATAHPFGVFVGYRFKRIGCIRRIKVKVTCEPSTCTLSSVMVNLKLPNIHNSNGDICTGYICCVNVELCNSVSISMLWQHKISRNQWVEYRKKYRNSNNFYLVNII